MQRALIYQHHSCPGSPSQSRHNAGKELLFLCRGGLICKGGLSTDFVYSREGALSWGTGAVSNAKQPAQDVPKAGSRTLLTEALNRPQSPRPILEGKTTAWRHERTVENVRITEL